LLCCGLLALPLLVVQLPPITDLPQHVAQVRLLTETLGDPSAPYEIQWLTPYGLVYLVVGVCWWLLPPMLVGRAAALAVVVLAVGAIHWLAARYERSVSAAILASVLVYSHVLYWGFLNFALGWPLFVLWLVWTDRPHPEKARGRCLMVTFLLSLFLYFAHILWLAAALLWLGVDCALERRGWREAALRFAGTVPVLLLTVYWFVSISESSFSTPAFWFPIWLRLLPPFWVESVFGGLRSPIEGVTLALILLWLVGGLWAYRRGSGESLPSRLAWCGAMFLLLFALLPDHYTNTMRLNDRWLPYAMICFVLAVPVPARRPVTTALAVLLLVGFTGLTTSYWIAFERDEMSGLSAALERLPEEPRVMGLDFRRTSRWVDGMPFLQCHAYAQVLRGGELNFSFADFAPSLVVYREPRSGPWTWQLEWFPERVRASDYPHFDSLLVHGDQEAQARFRDDSLLDEQTESGPWRLYRVQVHGAPAVDKYLNRYFQTFPSSATAAGLHNFDRQLENLGPENRGAWLRFNREMAARLEGELAEGTLAFEDQLDYELLLREIERQVFDYVVLERPVRDPLFWSQLLANATVFLMVRDDLPLPERIDSAIERARQIPRLAMQAEEALSSTDPGLIAPELCGIARRQIAASARLYREGFPRAAGPDQADLRARLEESGVIAADGLDRLNRYLTVLETEASGPVRLGEHYAENFRIVNRLDEPVDEVLALAERDLIAKVEETAEFGRSVWEEILPEEEQPVDDSALISHLFDRVSEDRASTTDEFVEDYRQLVDQLVQFVRERQIITLPEPLTLHLGRSPSFFVGQSVGGVYPAGPYAPAEAKTLLLLPTPPDDATADQLQAFFRDFNHHFNVMITPHELIPGHYLQLKYAAMHPRKVRALFGDGVYIEGWGTFCERLMLDQGWGEPLDRLAHLKKQLENIARTIVDIRVHTLGMTRDEVLRFVQEEAYQDEQFASNMWRRAITSSPQLTTYYLGYTEVSSLFRDVQQVQGEHFELRSFMDSMTMLGPVPVRHYREMMLGQ